MSVCLYSCRPKRRIGAAIAVSAFFFCSAMAFSAVGLNNPLRRIFNLTALFLLVVCFLVIKRFLATEYSYAVYSGVSDDLVIYEHTIADREPAVVARISLSCITEARAVGEKKRKKKTKIKRAYRQYSYAASVFEREYLLITCSDVDGDFQVKLAYDEGLLKTIENNMS